MAITKVTGALVDIGDLDLTNVGTLHLDSIVSDASPAAITVGYGPNDTLTINGLTTMTTDGNGDTLTLTSTDADASAGPALNLYRNSATPADNDFLANIKFNGRNDNTQDVQYAEVETYILDASDGDEDGLYNINVMTAGTNLSYMQISGNAGVVFNEDSNNLNFRVESDGNTRAISILGDKYGLGVGRDPESAYNGYASIELGQQGIILANEAGDDIWFGSNIYLDGSANQKRKEAGVAALWQIDGDVVSWYTAASGSADTTISWSMKNRFSAAGNLSFLAGQGIDFSATDDGDNSGSGMTSELLDDYEEGQHTTTVTGNTSGSWSLSSAGDEYTYCKIGRTVHCHGYITVTGESSSVGSIGFTLPFTAISGGASGDVQDDGEYSFGTMALIGGNQDKAANNYVFVQSGDKAYLYYVTDTGNGAYYDSGDVDTAWSFGFSFTYTAA